MQRYQGSPIQGGSCYTVFVALGTYEVPVGADLSKYPLRAAQFHCCETVGSSYLAQHAVYVVLHRLLGEIQLVGNFFISKPTAYHLNQLLFPARQAQIVFEVKAGSVGLVGG